MLPLLATATLVHAIYAATMAVAVGVWAFYHLGRR